MKRLSIIALAFALFSAPVAMAGESSGSGGKTNSAGGLSGWVCSWLPGCTITKGESSGSGG